jgi:hypothetical protein
MFTPAAGSLGGAAFVAGLVALHRLAATPRMHRQLGLPVTTIITKG